MSKTSEPNVFAPKASFLIKVEPLLNEYFGISYGYFEDEISTMKNYPEKVEIGESATLKALEQPDEQFILSTSFDLDDYNSLFQNIEEEDDADQSIAKVLLLLAYIVMEKDFGHLGEDNPDVTDQWEYNIVREDLLRLYVFANTHKPKTREGKKISIKHSQGDVPIDNYNNWFTEKLLKDYMATYLADVISVKQAEEELKTYKKRAGRKIKDNRVLIITYGIYRMFNEQKKMKSPMSDSLCNFIFSYH